MTQRGPPVLRHDPAYAELAAGHDWRISESLYAALGPASVRPADGSMKPGGWRVGKGERQSMAGNNANGTGTACYRFATQLGSTERYRTGRARPAG